MYTYIMKIGRHYKQIRIRMMKLYSCTKIFYGVKKGIYIVSHTPVILATEEAEIRRMWFEASLGKQLARPYLKKSHHKKGWWSGSRYRP
jgi:hypothetical protein